MSLMQMSVAGAVMILVTALLRAMLLNRLPKRTFLILWDAALVRLLVPFSFPSVFSVYSAVNRLPAVQEAGISPVVPGPREAVVIPPASAFLPAPVSPAPAVSQLRVNWWVILWAVGAAACLLWFCFCYFRCIREFRTSLPVRNDFARHWLKTHGLRRRVNIRQSCHISAPLTYGVARPVILMPKATDWEDTTALRYVLEHEYIHIRRFDAALKLCLTGALCVHWFNPAVWLLYFLANRDMELSCDEAVIRRFGREARSGYAMTLIHMEETKSGMMPLANGFSKNAIEERIRSIMKTKKVTLWISAIAAIIVAATVILFATSPKTEKPDGAMEHQAVPETTAAPEKAGLLEQITLELPGTITREPVSDTRDSLVRDGKVVGGIVVMELSAEGISDTETLVNYLETEIIADLVPSDYDYYMSTGSIGAALSVECGTRDRFFTHNIYQGDSAFYDVWFEDPLTSTSEVQKMLASIQSNDIPRSEQMPESASSPSQRISFDSLELPDGSWTAKDFDELQRAIDADEAAGTMIPDAPHAMFHYDSGPYSLWGNGPHDAAYILLGLFSDQDCMTYTIYPECENVMSWMAERGILETLEAKVVAKNWELSFKPVEAASDHLTLKCTRISDHPCQIQLEYIKITNKATNEETAVYYNDEVVLGTDGTAEITLDFTPWNVSLPAGNYRCQFRVRNYPPQSDDHLDCNVDFTIPSDNQAQIKTLSAILNAPGTRSAEAEKISREINRLKSLT